MSDNNEETKKEEIELLVQDQDFLSRFNTLTDKEKLYFQMMRARYGVLYIKSKPGIAKSAIAKSIAKKMGIQYIDIRLSMADETDMQFPNLIFREELDITVIEHAVPEWAVLSNLRPTLIHFEELNRAPQAVRNAALKILLEREITYKFSFNDNVFMMASGNLGEEDGTDVEEFDNALHNRLIQFEHSLTKDEWIEWGTGIIHPDIIDFIEAYPENMSKDPTENCPMYATPRSWHMVSEYIIKNFGGGPKLDDEGEIIMNSNGTVKFFEDGFKTDVNGNIVRLSKSKDGETYDSEPLRNWGDVKVYLSSLEIVLRSYIGDTAVKFLRFLSDRIKINLRDILDNFDKVKKDIDQFGRDRFSEMLNEAKGLNLADLKGNQINNLIKFLEVCDDDERTGLLLEIIDSAQHNYKKGVGTEQVRRLLKSFPDDLKNIKSINKANKKT